MSRDGDYNNLTLTRRTGAAFDGHKLVTRCDARCFQPEPRQTCGDVNLPSSQHATNIILRNRARSFKNKAGVIFSFTYVSLVGSLQYLQSLTMVNLHSMSPLAYLLPIVSIIGNARSNPTDLSAIVPKREVLYVGGKYTNITASSLPRCSFSSLRLHIRTMQPTPRQRR